MSAGGGRKRGLKDCSVGSWARPMSSRVPVPEWQESSKTSRGPPLWAAGEDPPQFVITDIGAVPVHVVGAEDLVQLAHKFVAVSIPALGAMPGEMERTE
jgi:hypothetical protein